MSREKHITQITDSDFDAIIKNSVQNASTRLVGNAAETKKMFVKPIANKDGKPNVLAMIQRMAAETEQSLEETDVNFTKVDEKADTISENLKEHETASREEFEKHLGLINDNAQSIENVTQDLSKYKATNAKAMSDLDTVKQDKLSFDGDYDAETNKVATERTVAEEIAKIVAGADSGFDTLKEIADWIKAHPESVAEINAKIQENVALIVKNKAAIAENKSSIAKNIESISGNSGNIDKINQLIAMINTTLQMEYSGKEQLTADNGIVTADVSAGYVVSVNNDIPQELVEMGMDAPNTNWIEDRAVVYEDKFYLFDNGTIQVYDTVSKTFTTLETTIPQSIYGMRGAAVGKKIYIFGGGKGALPSGCSTAIYKFDPELETITELSATLPVAVRGISSIVIGTNIYLYGGYQGNDYGAEVYDNTISVFDTETETITKLDVTGDYLPEGSDSALILLNDKIYMFGGKPVHSLNHIFDPATLTITKLSNELYGTNNYGDYRYHDVSAIPTENGAYLYCTASAHDSLDIFKFNKTDESFTFIKKLPVGYPPIVYGDKLYLLGAYSNGKYVTTMYTIEKTLVKLGEYPLNVKDYDRYTFRIANVIVDNENESVIVNYYVNGNSKIETFALNPDSAIDTLYISGASVYKLTMTSNSTRLKNLERSIQLVDEAVTEVDNKKQDKLVFADEYNALTNKAATEKTVANEIAKVVADAPDSLDSLEEIAAWILAHPESVAELNAKINANTEAIQNTVRYVDNLPDNLTLTDEQKAKWKAWMDVTDGADGQSVVYYEGEIDTTYTAIGDTLLLAGTAFLSAVKVGDLAISANGKLLKIKEPSVTEGFWICTLLGDLKGADGVDGQDGYSVLWCKSDITSITSMISIEVGRFDTVPKAGDLVISKNGNLYKVESVGGGWAYISYLAALKGADGKDALSSNFTDKYIPVYDATDKELKPSAIIDHGTETTPYLDINFGKANEIRKAFFEQSLLLGEYHYGSGFIQGPNGKRMSMPTLTQDETMATESGVEAVKAEVNTSWGYYGITGADKHEIKCNGIYIVFANEYDLKLCKADGTAVVTGAQQLFIMTTPYNGNKGTSTVFVAMGMYIYKSSLGTLVPVEGVQVELNDGSYITAGSTSTKIYVSEMVKGK